MSAAGWAIDIDRDDITQASLVSDPDTPLAPGQRATLEVKMLIIRGSLDDALERATGSGTRLQIFLARCILRGMADDARQPPAGRQQATLEEQVFLSLMMAITSINEVAL